MAGAVMSHNFHLRSSVLPLRFFPGGLGARLSGNEFKHLGSSGSSGAVAVASPSRTLQQHRVKATAKAVGEQETAHGSAALGWAARDASGVLSPFDFSRRAQKDDDVTIKVLYCGICHTDLYTIKNEWGTAMYPIVPGHEIVGVVTSVGSGASKFKAGETVGVGYFLGSCRSCECCGNGYENYCSGMVLNSNGIDPEHGGAVTRGGFSDVIVVNEDYVVRVPDGLPLAATLRRRHGVQPDDALRPQHPGEAPGRRRSRGVKFGKAFGMKVTVISTSPGKREEALERLGANEFLVSRDPEQMQAAVGTMDGILDTVSAWHPISPLFALMKPMGQMAFVGGPTKPLELPAYAIVPGGKGIAGNCLGGIRDCQPMVDFAGKHDITAEVEVIKMDYINTALERLEKNDVRYRFVIDVAGSLGSTG